jgi:hypothetical protein
LISFLVIKITPDKPLATLLASVLQLAHKVGFIDKSLDEEPLLGQWENANVCCF